MALKSRKKPTSLKTLLAAIADVQSQLHDIDQKLDHLIRNLRRLNGGRYSFNSHMSDLED
jgi:hypothetical protein